MGALDFLAGMPSTQPASPPPTDPSSLAAQLMGLGTVDMRHKLLQQQYDQGAQLAQGAPVDYTKGKGTPLLLAGLANLVSAGMGGYQEGKASGGLRDLVTEQAQGRKAGTDAAMQYSPPNLSQVQSASDTDLPAQMQTAQDSTNAGRRLAIALAASGDPSLAGVGKSIMGQTDDAQQSLQSMPQTRLQQAIEKVKLANEGPRPALGGLTDADAKAKAELSDAETKRLGISKFSINPVTGRAYDTRTGKDIEGSGGAGSPANDKRLPKMQADLEKDLDPNASRSGTLRQNQERLNAAQRLLTLAQDPVSGGPANLTPQQMSEVSSSLATLVGGGSSGEATRHELTPYTSGRTLADAMQWLTNAPQGAGQKAFVQQMIDTAKRESGTASQAIRQAQAQRLSSHAQYLQLFPDQAKAQLESYGFDPDEVDFQTGKYTPKVPLAPLVPPKAAAGAAPKRISGDADYDALPSGSTYIAPDGTTRTKR